MQPLILVLRVAILVLSIAVLGLLAYLVYAASSVLEYSYYYGYYYVRLNVPGFDYTLFVASWTILASIYYIMAAIERPLPKKATHTGALLGLDIVTNIFWLAAWAVNASYASSLGCVGDSTVCAILITAIVVAVVNWILLTIATVLSGLTVGGRSFTRAKQSATHAHDFSSATTPVAMPTHTPVAPQSPVSQMTQPVTYQQNAPSAPSAPSQYSHITATTQPHACDPTSQPAASDISHDLQPRTQAHAPITESASRPEPTAAPFRVANEMDTHPDARELEANQHGYYGNR